MIDDIANAFVQHKLKFSLHVNSLSIVTPSTLTQSCDTNIDFSWCLDDDDDDDDMMNYNDMIVILLWV